MKNLALTLLLVPFLFLSACGKEKKVVVDEQPTNYRTERVSGPLSDKEIAWENEDLQ